MSLYASVQLTEITFSKQFPFVEKNLKECFVNSNIPCNSRKKF